MATWAEPFLSFLDPYNDLFNNRMYWVFIWLASLEESEETVSILLVHKWSQQQLCQRALVNDAGIDSILHQVLSEFFFIIWRNRSLAKDFILKNHLLEEGVEGVITLARQRVLSGVTIYSCVVTQHIEYLEQIVWVDIVQDSCWLVVLISITSWIQIIVLLWPCH